MNNRIVFVALLLCSGCLSSWAGEVDKYGVVEKPVAVDTPDTFAQKAQWVHEQMQAGGRYEFVNAGQKARVDALLDKMANALQGAGSVDAMKHEARVALFNAQEELNGILKHNDANRLVCESRAPIGSHIPVTTCRTYGEIEHIRRTTKTTLDSLTDANRAQTTNGVNGCLTGERQYCPGQNGGGGRVR